MGKALRYCHQVLAVVRWNKPRYPDSSKQEAKDLLQAEALLIAQQGRIERSARLPETGGCPLRKGAKTL